MRPRTGDKIILEQLKAGRIRVDCDKGVVYGVWGKPLKPTIHNGYACVTLMIGPEGQRRARKVYVHRVIWLARHGEAGLNQCVSHERPPDSDNRIRNLKVGRRPPRNRGALTIQLVNRMRRHKRLTQKQLAVKFGVSQAHVSLVLRNLIWKGEVGCQRSA